MKDVLGGGALICVESSWLWFPKQVTPAHPHWHSHVSRGGEEGETEGKKEEKKEREGGRKERKRQSRTAVYFWEASQPWPMVRKNHLFTTIFIF